MSKTNITVNKQTVRELLTGGQRMPFVIPEYQRPYSWSDDEVTTLFEDLWEFSEERGTNENYFLGSVVSYDSDAERQIIDGQQRITSLCLLLRAILFRLEEDDNKAPEAKNFIKKIKPALWKENEMTGEVDRSNILLRSEVISDSGNEILRKILETGVADKKAKDNYSRNYNKFLELYREKASGSPLQVYNFILALLDYAILLPITADDQETALTIFNTLNNRGLPLSDADIFKSHIYKPLDEEEKKSFIKKWQDLELRASDAGESIQSLFYYHMFYLRARIKDVDTTTPGIRKYYLDKKEKRLTPEVVDELSRNLSLWEIVNKRRSVDEKVWSKNVAIMQALDSLSTYPNEFWKYPVSIFYMEHEERPDFEEVFLKFLRKLVVMLLSRYLEVPAVYAVKGEVLKLNVAIIGNCHPMFYAGFEKKALEDQESILVEKQRTDNLIIAPHRRGMRMLLTLLAYQEADQTELLPSSWEIEHIFPKKWDSKYYRYNEEEVNTYLEHLGNKIPLEKKLNSSASNGYFELKKRRYRESSIAVARALGALSAEEWNLESIKKNNLELCRRVKDIFSTWVEDYEAYSKE